MSKWRISIRGDQFSLERLELSNLPACISVIKENDTYYLESKNFDEFLTDREVRACGKEIVSIINGAGNLLDDHWNNIEIETVFNIDDYSKETGHNTAEDRATIHVSCYVDKKDGNSQNYRSLSRFEAALSQDSIDPNIEKALRIFGSRQHNWQNLYCIYEIVQDGVGGQAVIVGNDWCSEETIRLFKHTANSSKAVGDDARHQNEPHDPPENPMYISDAEAFIKDLLIKWVESKT